MQVASGYIATGLVLLVLSSSTVGVAADLCLVNTAADNRNITIFCDSIPGAWPNSVVGYRTDGPPCDTRTGSLCGTFDFAIWTLSSSAGDPYVNSGPLEEPGTLYLWVECTQDILPVAYAEFDLVGDLDVLDLTPMNGFTNSGTPTEPRLSVSGCPTPPILAATISVSTPTSVDGSTWGQVKSVYR
jgi:hypothetical protein